MLDVRLPIGALFFILGIMIGAWGYTHPPAGSIETKFGLLPINFDIVWGWLMTCFGLAVFSIAKWDEAAAMQRALEKEMQEKAAEKAALEAAAEVGSEQSGD
ncbi:MAG: hypothetical protein JSS86_25590 [Cyanobacteria bacterium SZAS LIN-2]|nr:hypothetical protein [Cyanobacteria bacterium SZAS LIN-3]MBS1999731.1 hypothetical protein [Cyanobacteria bacterium SZAS LIN-2]MBS2007612.1 hypothetical protein [Cyanobacteria bacterium SZAS TMP-1]